jgi:hypothetical protein
MVWWNKGIALGATSWQPSGRGRDLASRFSSSVSGASPARERYDVPQRPCDRSARARRRGRHHAHSSARTAHHATASAAAHSSASFHGSGGARASPTEPPSSVASPLDAMVVGWQAVARDGRCACRLGSETNWIVFCRLTGSAMLFHLLLDAPAPAPTPRPIEVGGVRVVAARCSPLDVFISRAGLLRRAHRLRCLEFCEPFPRWFYRPAGAVAGRPLVFSGHACRSATNFWKKERRTLRKEKQGSNVTRTHI